MEILDKMLNPAVVWVFIPVLALLFWGIHGTIRALRGDGSDVDECRAEIEQLRQRIESLEQATKAPAGDHRIGAR